MKLKCVHCDDTGLVSCYDPRLVLCVQDGREKLAGYRLYHGDRLNLVTQVVPCSCRYGDTHAARTRRDGTVTQRVRFPCGHRLQVRLHPEKGKRRLTAQDHLAWIEQHTPDVTAMPNYSQELAEY